MDRPERTYWSLEKCGWDKLPARELIEAEAAAVPAQREDEPAQEPVEA
ncbi:MAG: hypothetical protein QOE99_383 [Actinomycetota bacterium]|jgi:hypothetical protein|nr:hypothetical protein [Actinomycetota bacterium]